MMYNRNKEIQNEKWNLDNQANKFGARHCAIVWGVLYWPLQKLHGCPWLKSKSARWWRRAAEMEAQKLEACFVFELNIVRQKPKNNGREYADLMIWNRSILPLYPKYGSCGSDWVGSRGGFHQVDIPWWKLCAPSVVEIQKQKTTRQRRRRKNKMRKMPCTNIVHGRSSSMAMYRWMRAMSWNWDTTVKRHVQNTVLQE